jgi:hypothetical protein
MMKVNEALKVSIIPILMIIILQAASVVSFMNCCSWPIMVLLYLSVGHICSKKGGLGVEDAAVTGAIAGMAAGAVFAASIFIYNLLFGSVSSFVFSNANDFAQSLSGGAIGGLIVVFLIPVFGIGGAVLSFLGYSFLGKILRQIKFRY